MTRKEYITLKPGDIVIAQENGGKITKGKEYRIEETGTNGRTLNDYKIEGEYIPITCDNGRKSGYAEYCFIKGISDWDN